MRKIELKIRTLPDSILRQTVKPVEKITDHHRKVLSEMAKLMYSVSGVGLAASQVGILESMFVADAGGQLYKLINPKIIQSEGEQTNEEGCLSVPALAVKVKRAKNVVLQAKDETGKAVTIEAQDLLACVFQHEIDHLNGKLIVDYASEKEKSQINKNI